MAFSIVLLVVTGLAPTSAGGVGRNFVQGPPEERATEYTGPPYEAPFLRQKEIPLGTVLRSIKYVLETMFPPPPPQKAVSAPQRPSVALPAPTASQVPQGAPTPISDARCVDRGRPDIGQMIEATFGPAGPWAESVVVRESGCNPTAQNSSGANGLFQMLGHEDIFIAICGSNNWADPACNIAAAYSLYQGSGTSPWRL